MEAGQGKVARAHVPSPNMDVLDGEKGLLSKSLDRNLSIRYVTYKNSCNLLSEVPEFAFPWYQSFYHN